MRNIEKDPRDVLTAFAREAGVPIRKGFYDFYNRSLLRASDEDLNRWYECKALKLFTGKGEFNKKAVEYAESHRGIIFTIIGFGNGKLRKIVFGEKQLLTDDEISYEIRRTQESIKDAFLDVNL